MFSQVSPSALFAALAYLGQKAFAIAGKHVAGVSKKRRRTYLTEQQIKYNVLAAKDIPERGAFVSLLTYRASRSLFKALIWLTGGLMLGAADALLGVVGYFGCLYYLFLGLNTVTGPETVKDIHVKLEEIRQELTKLDEA